MARKKIYSDEEIRLIKSLGGSKLTYLLSLYSGVCVTTIYQTAKQMEKHIDHDKIIKEIKNESRT